MQRLVCAFTVFIFCFVFFPVSGQESANDGSLDVELILDQGNSFTVFVSGNRLVSLQGLRFEVTVRDRTRSFQLNQFSSFQGLNFNSLQAPFCLRLVLRAANVGFPQNCLDSGIQNLNSHFLEPIDVFWYDDLSQNILPIRVFIGEELIGNCPANQNRCSVLVPPQTDLSPQVQLTIRPQQIVVKPNQTISLTAEVMPNLSGLYFRWEVTAGGVEIDDSDPTIFYTAPNELGTVRITLSALDSRDNQIAQDSIDLLVSNRDVLYDGDFTLGFYGSSRGCSADYLDDEERWNLQVNCSAMQYIAYLNKTFSDFELEVTAQKTDGTNRGWYGIVLTIGKGTSQQIDHRFLISGLGTYTYEVATFRNGETQTGLDIVQGSVLTPAVARREGINAIRLVRIGENVELWVNNVLIYQNPSTLLGDYEVDVGLIAITPDEEIQPGDDQINVAFTGYRIFAVE